MKKIRLKAVRRLNTKCESLQNELKMVNKEAAFAAKSATTQALQLVCQPVPFDERDCTRVTQYACKDLFWTFKFFTLEEDILDYSKKGSPGGMTMAYFDVEPKKADTMVEPVSVSN